MKYLIVEDDFSDVSLLNLRLKKLGCDVTIVYPYDALQENKVNKPAVIQLDGLDGKCFELHQQLKEDNPDGEYILFSSRMELYKKAHAAGMKVFDKTSGGSDLLEYIRKLLKK